MRIPKLILPVICLCIFAAADAQIVTTQFGPINGSLNGTVYQFLGIPFAKPPVGSLRWAAPQNPAPWSSAINTINFAPKCPQKNFETGGTTSTVEGSEDCLYLNVWTPALSGADRPVLVFIHGGGNQQGSASEVTGGTQIYFGKNMAERGNAVIVTIQYRLGPLGFLVHPGLEPENANQVSGNYAVMDQLLALTWVKNNIAAFGGNPAKVMVFGESAGGVDVGNLLVTPLAAGLFQKACIQSAAPVINSYADSRNKGIAYADSFITSGTDVQKIAYLRTLSADTLVKFEEPPLSGGAVGMNWQPVIDNVIFSNFPKAAFQSGNFNKVPLITGSNSEEMSLSVPATVTPIMVTALIAATVPLPLRPQATALYPPGSTNAQAKQSYIGILTDAQFTTPTRRTAQCVSLNQTQPVWRYFFTHKHTIPALASLGSYHGMELFFVFNSWENATLGSGPLFHAADDSVQNLMLRYWVNFANTGNPNGTGLPTWPQYQAAADCYLEIKGTPAGDQCGVRTAKSDLWDAVGNYSICSSVLPVKITDFTATFSACTAKLKWQTSGEQNISDYVIEQSGDGINFSAVGKVLSRNISAPFTYFYTTALKAGGRHFFRLRTNETNGSSSYTSIINGWATCGMYALTVLSAPSAGNVKFNLSVPVSCRANVMVYDAAGATVFSTGKNLSVGENRISFNELLRLAKGVYIIKVNTEFGVLIRQFLL